MNNISIFLLFNNRRKGTNFFFRIGAVAPAFFERNEKI